MADKPWRSVGMFDISPEWTDSHFAGAEHHYAQFALFIRLPDGSSAGYWLGSGVPGPPPIVVLGSEGQNTTLAPDLETLLARIAFGDFSDKGPEADFLHHDGDFEGDIVPDLRGDLGRFLAKEAGITDFQPLLAKARTTSADFAAWVQQADETYRKTLAATPDMQAITAMLAPYKPDGKEAWESSTVRITWAGDDVDVWRVTADGPQDLAEADRLRPLLTALRSRAAAQTPGLGLWHSATLLVHPEDVTFIPDYLYEPSFRSRPAPIEAFKADQTRAPREARRIPSWLRLLLA